MRRRWRGLRNGLLRRLRGGGAFASRCEVGGYGGDEEFGCDVWWEGQGEVFGGVEEEEVEVSVQGMLSHGT